MMNIQHQLIDIASRDVTCLAVDDTLGEAASIMAQRRFSSIVVTDEARHPLGIVTERNILQAMRAGSAPDTLLRSSMSAPVVVMSGATPCLDAYQTCMREGIRHLVLIDDDGAVAGVVSETDFRQHMSLTVLAGRRQVVSVAQRSIPTLTSRSNLMQALNLMQAQRETCVVVVEDEKPVGIVTERDVVRFYASEPQSIGVSIAEVMTAPVLTISSNATINQAAELMLERRLRHLAVVDGAGRMVGLVSEHDLTQTMATGLLNEKIEIDEIFLRTFIDTIPDLVWVKDVAGKFLSCNRRFEHVLGLQGNGILGKTDYDIVGREQADFFREHDRIAMAADGPTVNEEWVSFPAVGQRWLLETIKTPMRDGQGRVIGVLGVARDITDRESARVALLKSEHEFRTLAENLPDNIIRYDRDCRVRYMNPAMQGSIAPELLPTVGKAPVESTPDSPQIRDLQRVVEQVMDSGEKIGLEFEILHPNGGMRVHHVIFVPELDQQGVVTGALGIGRDITERKRADAQLDDYRRRLEGLVAEESSKFRALVEQSLVGIYIIQDGFFRYVNPGLLRMFGYDAADEVVDMISIFQFVKNEDRSLVEANIRQGGEESIRYSFAAKKRDGTAIIIDAHGRRIEYQGRPAIIGTLVDITEMRRSKEELMRLVEEKSAELRQSEEKLRSLIEAIPDPIQFKDGNGRWLEANHSARQTFCLDNIDCHGMTDKELSEIAAPFCKAALLHCYETDEAVWQADGISRTEEIIPQSDGSLLNFDVIKKPLFHQDGRRKGLVIVGRDITELKRAEAELRITASVFENSQEAVVISDANNTIINVNPAFTRITGYSRDEVLGKNPKMLNSGRQDKLFYAEMWRALGENKAWRGEIWNRRKCGEIYAELLSISAICDEAGKVQSYVGVFSDITYFKDHEAELSRVANYDALTGIPNRRLLADRLSQAIAHAQRGGKILAICYIDLDGFKEVNDNYGHEAGDILLVDITRRLQEVLRAGDTLARLGGDEFVLLFNDLSHELECFQVLERVMQTIAVPIRIDGHLIVVSASIGVTFYPENDADGDTLLRHADQAMYIAKQSGKNRYHIYDPVHDQRMRQLHESRRLIQQGLEKGEFELYYQPKLDLVANKIVGVEALIRWNHPERGLLYPIEFLPAIENSELEIRLGSWVLDMALAQLHAWLREGLDMEVSINISARHLQSPGFVKELQRKLEKYPKLPQGRLQIEVLETAALEDMEQSAGLIDACRELGVSFALDDFGTGYSSLMYLSKLSADTLKIDQSFVQGMATNSGDRAIVQGVIALANTFGRKTVAEGIEDPGLMSTLADLGCCYGQGYSIAQPMPAGEFVDWFRNR